MLRSIITAALFFVFVVPTAKAQTTANQLDVESVSIFEVCQLVTIGMTQDKTRQVIRCSNSGLTPVVEVAEPAVHPAPGVIAQANVGDDLYREDMRLKLWLATLHSPLEAESAGASLRLESGTKLKKHLVNRKEMYCWFDLKPFTQEELKRLRIRASPLGPPPFEAACFQDKDRDGAFELASHRARGEISFRNFRTNVEYATKEEIVLPLSEFAGMQGWGEPGEPFLSQAVKLKAVIPEGVQVAFPVPGDVRPDVFLIPVVGGRGERLIRGLQVTIESVSGDAITYTITGRFKPWAEVANDR